MKYLVISLSVLSLTGCGLAGSVVGRVARIPSDIVKGTMSYDEQGAEQPSEFEHGELGGL